ncbi:MAG TPA: hypothetical protein VH989_01065 [Actinomycetota bacterium]|jgi:hypothetical protein
MHLALGFTIAFSDWESDEHSWIEVVGLVVVIAAALVTFVLRGVARHLQRSAQREGLWEEIPSRARLAEQHLDDRPDPGWDPALRGMLSRVLGYGYFRREPTADPLQITRRVFVGLGMSVVLFAVVWSYMMPFYVNSGGSLPVLVIAVGLTSGLLTLQTRLRRLDLSSSAALAYSYRQRMFRGIGFAEIPGFTGMICSFLSEPAQWWLYALGGGLTLGLLAIVAPGPRDIQRTQATITSAGSTLSLLSILQGDGSAAPPNKGETGAPRDGLE